MNAWESAPYAATALVLQPPLAGEPGEVELVGFAPGPAGTASTQVHGDVTIDVDFAEPDRLCALEADDVGGSRTLEQLIGPESFRMVRAAMLSGDDRSRRLTPPRNSLNSSRRPRTSEPRADERLREFAFALASRAVGDDPYESPLVRAVAHLESTALLVVTGWTDLVDGDGLEEQLVFAAEALVQDANDEQLIAELDLRDYERLREAVMQAAQHPAWANKQWMQQLMRRFPRRLVDLDAQRDLRFDRGVARSAPAMFSPVASQSAALHHDALPLLSVEAPTQVERLGPGRYVYRYDTRPDGTWLRLVDAASQSLVALAPIKREGRTWSAQVVLPVTVEPASLVSQATDSPTIGSTSTVDTMIEAIELGRAAARLSAAGDAAAVGRWQLCAQAWTELGDDSRARRALAYATGIELVSRPNFVHDRVRELEANR